jgi:hypothetical protein
MAGMTAPREGNGARVTIGANGGKPRGLADYPTQRTVAAIDSTMPKTSAPSSVFAQVVAASAHEGGAAQRRQWGIRAWPEGLETPPYVWRFDSLGEADNAANRMATELRVSVVVFEIIGTYVPMVEWRGPGR